MNEFLQQFVIESREIVEAASEELLILEQSPRDAARLDAVFRAFHTLKGSAGIVEFAAMERAMHAAEDVLSEARSGKHSLTPAHVGQCLACLDRVLQWLDAVEQTGELPSDSAQQAEQLIQQFELVLSDSKLTDPSIEKRSSSSWIADLLSEHSQLRARASSAVRFSPAADSFYQGEDPLERMTSLPGLLALVCAPVSPWATLDGFDPFTCNLTLSALSAASSDDVADHLQGHSGNCEIVALSPAEVEGVGPLPANVVAVIKAQLAFLDEGTPRNFVGRVGSAGATAANALRFCGRMEQAEALLRAMENSLLEVSTQPLREALTQLFVVASPPPAPGTPPEVAQSPEIAGRTVRIDADRVDALVRLVGELTVVGNAIGHTVKLARLGDVSVADILKDQHGALEHLLGELQRSVLAIRVRPLRAVLQRFPRIVREMSASLGKAVRLHIDGDDTEADKTIVEMLFEPLLHVVRNAIDHGVESEKDRIAAGKPAVANLHIEAQRKSDQVVIEVSDDGAGIDLARVREVAKARGIVTEEALRTMTEADALDLIFAPGFSTATEVTQVSGRGVGMDAVRKAVERTGGQVSIASRAGQGTTVRLLLPFSVMVTHVLTVEAGGQMFGLPLEAIVETVRVPQAAIAKVGATHAVVLRNRTIPVVDLATVLGVERAWKDESEATLVIAAANGEWGAFRVDRVDERLDVILKPLEGLLAGIPGIVGTTLLGDGRVLLVLDIGEMLQ